jgi:mRNA interferase MazF
VRRGEILWYTFEQAPAGATADAIERHRYAQRDHRRASSTNDRGLATEVLLSSSDGMPESCALNFDHVTLVQRGRLGAVITELPLARWPEVEQAMLVACGFRVD